MKYLEDMDSERALEERGVIDDGGVGYSCFCVYVGESWPDHNVNWDRFYVDRESMQIYWFPHFCFRSSILP